MERTKLTSIRLEMETATQIEEIAKNERYIKKSDVINNILAAVLQNFTSQEVRNMVYRHKWYHNVVVTKFEPTKELKPLRRAVKNEGV